MVINCFYLDTFELSPAYFTSGSPLFLCLEFDRTLGVWSIIIHLLRFPLTQHLSVGEFVLSATSL